jgi:hypothetical protein
MHQKIMNSTSSGEFEVLCRGLLVWRKTYWYREISVFGLVSRGQILLIKAVCLARLQAREFGVATCIL